MTEIFGSSLCPAEMWDDFFREKDWRNPRYQAYSGHFGIDLADFIGSDLRVFTVLRDPIDRTISHYLEVCRNFQHPLHDIVIRQSFKDFVSDPSTASMIYNVQARYLTRSIVSIDTLTKIFTPYWKSKYTLSVAWEHASAFVNEAELERESFRAFHSLAYIGVTDCLDEDTPRMQKTLGVKLQVSERRNVSPGNSIKQELSPFTKDRIRSLTKIDTKLYQAARRRLGHT